MLSLSRTFRTAACLLFTGVALVGRAAIPITPELQQLSEEDRLRRMEFEAQASLREKIQAGQQRYEARQAYRKMLVEGMTSQSEVRRGEILAAIAANPDHGKEAGFGYSKWIIGSALAIGSYLAFQFFRRRQAEEPDFTHL